METYRRALHSAQCIRMPLRIVGIVTYAEIWTETLCLTT